jgi:hypothetical protein
MSIRQALSSQRGERTETANREVAALCLEQPNLLGEIAAGLESEDERLRADCAEVLTFVAEARPELVKPLARQLGELLDQPHTRTRWEAAHALALVAGLAPRQVTPRLPALAERMRHDPSVIVRDYVVEALANYAGSGRAAAERAWPLLKQALDLHGGKHAARALRGLGNVARWCPAHAAEVRALAYARLDAGRGVTRAAARAVLRGLARETGQG